MRLARNHPNTHCHMSPQRRNAQGRWVPRNVKGRNGWHLPVALPLEGYGGPYPMKELLVDIGGCRHRGACIRWNQLGMLILSSGTLISTAVCPALHSVVLRAATAHTWRMRAKPHQVLV